MSDQPGAPRRAVRNCRRARSRAAEFEHDQVGPFEGHRRQRVCARVGEQEIVSLLLEHAAQRALKLGLLVHNHHSLVLHRSHGPLHQLNRFHKGTIQFSERGVKSIGRDRAAVR